MLVRVESLLCEGFDSMRLNTIIGTFIFGQSCELSWFPFWIGKFCSMRWQARWLRGERVRLEGRWTAIEGLSCILKKQHSS